MSGSGNGGGSSSSPTQRTHGYQRIPTPPLETPSSPTSPHHAVSPTTIPPSKAHHEQQQQQQHHDVPILRMPPRPPAPPPLLLTVRFSTSRPDLLLDIPHPRRTTVAALKHLIRSRLDQPDSQRRLRFIHGGRILPDAAVLGAVLKPLPPPPLPASHADPKGKGKAVMHGGASGSGSSHPPQRVYVICSIGDLLTDDELDAERRRAEEPAPEEHAPAAAGASSSAPDGGAATATAAGTASGRGVQSRGFDRLLAAGFTPSEVNQLRLQFRSIQEARHTADTMPSPDTLRGLEDAWMDNNNATNNGAGGGALAAAMGGADGEDGGGGGPAAAAVGDEFGLAGVLDLLLRGMLIGFVWPLGAVGWLVRDEEKIPKRMRVFVYFGFVLSLLIGTIRTIG